MSCPRCGGCSLPTELVSFEETIRAERCLICGWIGGEATIDTHHALKHPPEPGPHANLPIWDPDRCRLRIRFET